MSYIRRKKQKASSRWKKTQSKISKVTRTVANQRSNWVHQVASDIVRCNSFVATEKLEVAKMTRKAKKGGAPKAQRKRDKRKKQKAGLNKSIRAIEAPEISTYWVGCKNQPFNEVRAGSLL